MKDPLHQKETPYDILDIPTDASQAEIIQAIPKYIKKHGNKDLPQAQAAWRAVKDIKSRIVVDIFYYVMSGIESNEPPLLDIDINDFLEIPILRIEDAFTDLDKEDFSDEFMEIRFKQFKMSPCRYDDLEHSRLDVVFDK